MQLASEYELLNSLKDVIKVKVDITNNKKFLYKTYMHASIHASLLILQPNSLDNVQYSLKYSKYNKIAMLVEQGLTSHSTQFRSFRGWAMSSMNEILKLNIKILGLLEMFDTIWDKWVQKSVVSCFSVLKKFRSSKFCSDVLVAVSSWVLFSTCWVKKGQVDTSDS